MGECIRCGKCCKSHPCGIAIATIHQDWMTETIEEYDTNLSTPCLALEYVDGQYRCGMLIHASKYLDLGPNAKWNDGFMAEIFSEYLGIGLGCCTSPQTKKMVAAMKGTMRKLGHKEV